MYAKDGEYDLATVAVRIGHEMSKIKLKNYHSAESELVISLSGDFNLWSYSSEVNQPQQSNGLHFNSHGRKIIGVERAEFRDPEDPIWRLRYILEARYQNRLLITSWHRTKECSQLYKKRAPDVLMYVTVI